MNMEGHLLDKEFYHREKRNCKFSNGKLQKIHMIKVCFN